MTLNNTLEILNIDEIYHIGARQKDLGKKWFAFSKFESDSFGILEILRYEDKSDKLLKIIQSNEAK